MSENPIVKKNNDIDILNLQNFDVTLTYGWLPETISFPSKILLSLDEKEIRQKFYAQTAEKQAAGKHEFNVEMICLLVTDKPRNLPGFDALFDETENVQPGTSGQKSRLKIALYNYFSRENDIIKNIADDFFNQHTRETQPAEFFRVV